MYCGTYLEEWEKVIDHFLPHCMGVYGVNNRENLVVSCRECNSIKNSMVFLDLREARDYILPIKSKKGVPKKYPKKEDKYRRKPISNDTKRECKGCGDIFLVSNRKREWCADSCKNKYYAESIKEFLKICEGCNKEFLLSKYTHKAQKFCSRGCANKFR